MSELEQIQALEERLRRAMLASDVRELDLLISDKSTISAIDGRLLSKADDIAAHQTGSLRIATLTPQEESTIQLLPDVAIVFALMDVQGISQQQPFAARCRYTRVWHNEGGEWQIIAAHISLIPG